MKKIIYLLIVLGLSFQMISCEKEEDKSYSSMIVGIWRCSQLIEGNTVWDEWEDEKNYRLIFKADGTGMERTIDDAGKVVRDYTFTWSIWGSNLVMESTTPYVESNTLSTIEKITDTELVIKYEFISSHSPAIWRECYKREK